MLFYLNKLVTVISILPGQYDKYIYVTDWHSRAIERYSKMTGKGKVLVRGNMDGLMDIHMVAPSRQTGENSTVMKLIVIVITKMTCNNLGQNDSTHCKSNMI